MFKLIGSHNGALAAPWFQDGAAATLPEMVRLMTRYRSAPEPASGDISSIVEFLHAGSGEQDSRRF
jgi:cytochrome c peroxidase